MLKACNAAKPYIFKNISSEDDKGQAVFKRNFVPSKRPRPQGSQSRYHRVFLHSHNEKIWGFTHYCKNWVENGSFHEIMQKFMISRMEVILRIHIDLFFVFTHSRKKKRPITQTRRPMGRPLQSISKNPTHVDT